jgi:hypothetical protein
MVKAVVAGAFPSTAGVHPATIREAAAIASDEAAEVVRMSGDLRDEGSLMNAARLAVERNKHFQ